MGRAFFAGAAVLLAAMAPALWGHESKNAAVLARYSRGYAVLLALHGLAGATALALTLLPEAYSGRARAALAAAARRSLAPGWALTLAVAALWAGLIVLALVFLEVELASAVSLHLAALGAAVWFSGGLIVLARSAARSRARALGRLAIVLVTVAAAVLAIEAALRARPDVLPPALLASLPGHGAYLSRHHLFETPLGVGFRYRPGAVIADQLLASAANLRRQQPAHMKPLPPGADRILIEHRFDADDLGYANPPPLPGAGAVAVSGDSMTALAAEPRPWPSWLAAELGGPVLNLGIQGYGPQAESEALIRFALPRKPRAVILAYFEGNDLADAEIYEEKKRSGLAWDEQEVAGMEILERSLILQWLRHVAAGIAPVPRRGAAREGPGEPPYPFEASIAGRVVPMSFSTNYLSRLSLSRHEIESLEVMPAVIAALERLGSAAEAAGARLAIAYFPTREHAYAPAFPRPLLEAKLGGARRPDISELRLTTARPGPERVTATGLLATLDGQRAALTEALRARGLEVIDLTPAFQAAAARGEQLYFVDDTHWNAAGHALAAAVIADWVRHQP